MYKSLKESISIKQQTRFQIDNFFNQMKPIIEKLEKKPEIMKNLNEFIKAIIQNKEDFENSQKQQKILEFINKTLNTLFGGKLEGSVVENIDNFVNLLNNISEITDLIQTEAQQDYSYLLVMLNNICEFVTKKHKDLQDNKQIQNAFYKLTRMIFIKYYKMPEYKLLDSILVDQKLYYEGMIGTTSYKDIKVNKTKIEIKPIIKLCEKSELYKLEQEFDKNVISSDTKIIINKDIIENTNYHINDILENIQTNIDDINKNLNSKEYAKLMYFIYKNYKYLAKYPDAVDEFINKTCNFYLSPEEKGELDGNFELLQKLFDNENIYKKIFELLSNKPENIHSEYFNIIINKILEKLYFDNKKSKKEKIEILRILSDFTAISLSNIQERFNNTPKRFLQKMNTVYLKKEKNKFEETDLQTFFEFEEKLEKQEEISEEEKTQIKNLINSLFENFKNLGKNLWKENKETNMLEVDVDVFGKVAELLKIIDNSEVLKKYQRTTYMTAVNFQREFYNSFLKEIVNRSLMDFTEKNIDDRGCYQGDYDYDRKKFKQCNIFKEIGKNIQSKYKEPELNVNIDNLLDCLLKFKTFDKNHAQNQIQQGIQEQKNIQLYHEYNKKFKQVEDIYKDIFEFLAVFYPNIEVREKNSFINGYNLTREEDEKKLDTGYFNKKGESFDDKITKAKSEFKKIKTEFDNLCKQNPQLYTQGQTDYKTLAYSYNFDEKYLKIFHLLFENITIEQMEEVAQKFKKGEKSEQKSIEQQEQTEKQKQLKLQQQEEEKSEFFNFINSFKYNGDQSLFTVVNNNVENFVFNLGYNYNAYENLIEQKGIDYICNGFYKYYQSNIQTLKQKFKEGQEERRNNDIKEQEIQQQKQKAEQDFKSYAESKGLYNIYTKNEQKQAGTGYTYFFANLGYNYIDTTEEEFEQVCGYLEKFDSNFNKELAKANFENGKEQKARQDFKSYAENKKINNTNLYNIYTENEQKQAETGYTYFFANLGYNYIDTTEEEFEQVCGYLEKFDSNFNKELAKANFENGKEQKARQDFTSYAESKGLYNIYTENERTQAGTGYTYFFANLGYKYIDTTEEEFEQVCGYLEKFDSKFDKNEAMQQFNYGKQQKVTELQQSTTYQPTLHNSMQQTIHYNYQPQQFTGYQQQPQQPQQQNTQMLYNSMQSQNIMPQQFTSHQQIQQMNQSYNLHNQQFYNVERGLQNYSMGMSLGWFGNGNYQNPYTK